MTATTSSTVKENSESNHKLTRVVSTKLSIEDDDFLQYITTLAVVLFLDVSKDGKVIGLEIVFPVSTPQEAINAIIESSKVPIDKSYDSNQFFLSSNFFLVYSSTMWLPNASQVFYKIVPM
jgi:uncharacterized protein YuzE